VREGERERERKRDRQTKKSSIMEHMCSLSPKALGSRV
jgi:hypothetical protein